MNCLHLITFLFAIVNAERYVGVVIPNPRTAVGKCNDTCFYFAYGASRADVTSAYLGSLSGYAYAKEDYEFPRKVLQRLRYDGLFNDVKNNTECTNDFYETYRIGEVSVGTDNTNSSCYDAVVVILKRNDFEPDDTYDPEPETTNSGRVLSYFD